LSNLFQVNMKDWRGEADDIRSFLRRYGGRMPLELWDEYNRLERQIK